MPKTKSRAATAFEARTLERWELEAGSRKLEAGSGKREAGIWEMSNDNDRPLVVGCVVLSGRPRLQAGVILHEHDDSGARDQAAVQLGRRSTPCGPRRGSDAAVWPPPPGRCAARH